MQLAESDLMSKKVFALGLSPSTNKGDEGDGPFLRVTSGDYYMGPFDVNTGGIVFWRGDTRGPGQVFQTGFSSRYVRDGKGREIVWRAGVDDIVPASAVCLARDIRGAAFFPYPELDDDAIADSHYLYALVVPFAACTHAMQKVVERVETGANDWRDPARFAYDPTWDDSDNTSCVWQFAEYAVHEVKPWQILASWKMDRMYLVKDTDDERGQAGIRFRLHGEQRNLACNRPGALASAQVIARAYYREYPRKYPHFLSYWGIVEAMKIPAASKAEAARTARQLQPLVTASDHDWNVRDDGGAPDPGAVRLDAPPLHRPGYPWT
jgi:hypothetical protein